MNFFTSKHIAAGNGLLLGGAQPGIGECCSNALPHQADRRQREKANLSISAPERGRHESLGKLNRRSFTSDPESHLAGLGPHPIARHISGHPHLSSSRTCRMRASYKAETASQTAACNARISVTVAEVLARPSPHSAATPKSLRCSRAADTLWCAPSIPSARCTSPR